MYYSIIKMNGVKSMMVKDMSGLGWHGRKLTKFVSCLLSWENMNAKCTIYYTQTQGAHGIFNFIVHKPDQIFKKKPRNIKAFKPERKGTMGCLLH